MRRHSFCRCQLTTHCEILAIVAYSFGLGGTWCGLKIVHVSVVYIFRSRANSNILTRRLCRNRSCDDNELYRSNSFKFERFRRDDMNDVVVNTLPKQVSANRIRFDQTARMAWLMRVQVLKQINWCLMWIPWRQIGMARVHPVHPPPLVHLTSASKSNSGFVDANYFRLLHFRCLSRECS